MGHLHALWHAALEQSEDGDLSHWSDETIAEFSDYPGDAPQYVRLLRKHGWLDGKILHDWLDYAGLYLIKKYNTSNRAKLVQIWAKHGAVYGRERLENEKRTEREPTLPYPTKPHQTKPNKGLERSDRTIVAVAPGLELAKARSKNSNSNNLSPPDNHNHTLDRVVEFAKDEKSRAFYQKSLKVLGEGLVEEAMGEVKMREADGTVDRRARARYLTTLLVDWMENRGL
jgi:hypothetical protein